MDDFEIKPANNRGNGLFAKRDFAKGQVILQFEGQLVSFDDIVKQDIPINTHQHFIQVGESIFLDTRFRFQFFVNHSCVPNCYIKIAVSHCFLVAKYDIKQSEELFYDYSLVRTGVLADYRFDCQCGNYACRKVIGNFGELPQGKQDEAAKSGLLPKHVKVG